MTDYDLTNLSNLGQHSPEVDIGATRRSSSF
jgi:hypothetical protein